jgi:multidrug efflux system outer membrane protein
MKAHAPALAANVAQSYFEARGLAVPARRRPHRRPAAERRPTTWSTSPGKRRPGRHLGSRPRRRPRPDPSPGRRFEAQLPAAKRSLLILTGRGIEPTGQPADRAQRRRRPPSRPPCRATCLGSPPRRARGPVALDAAAGAAVAELARFPTFTLTPGVGLSRANSRLSLHHPVRLDPGLAASPCRCSTSSACTPRSSLRRPHRTGGDRL